MQIFGRPNGSRIKDRASRNPKPSGSMMSGATGDGMIKCAMCKEGRRDVARLTRLGPCVVSRCGVA